MPRHPSRLWLGLALLLAACDPQAAGLVPPAGASSPPGDTGRVGEAAVFRPDQDSGPAPQAGASLSPNAGLPEGPGLSPNAGLPSGPVLPPNPGASLSPNAGLPSAPGLSPNAGLPDGPGFSPNAGLPDGPGLSPNAGLPSGAEESRPTAPAGLVATYRTLALNPPASTVQAEVDERGECMLAPLPQGGAWLVWNQGHAPESPLDWGSRWQKLDADLAPVGPALAGPEDFNIAALCALPDGGLAAIGERRKPGGKGPGRPPIQEWHDVHDAEGWYLRFNAQGQEVARLMLVGKGKITDPFALAMDRTDSRIMAVGDGVALYFPVVRNFADAGAPPDTHQGDYFLKVGPDHRILPGSEELWLASHSHALQMAPGPNPNSALTVSVGDGYPFGLNFHNSETQSAVVVWQPSGLEAVKAVNGTTTHTGGWPGGMSFLNGTAWISFHGDEVAHPWSYDGDVKSPQRNRPILLGVDANGRRQHVLAMAAPARLTAHVPNQVLGQDELLVAWGNYFHPDSNPEPSTPTFAVYHPGQKAFSVAPFRFPVPFSPRSPWVRLADGSVAWAVSQAPYLDQARIVRISRVKS